MNWDAPANRKQDSDRVRHTLRWFALCANAPYAIPYTNTLTVSGTASAQACAKSRTPCGEAASDLDEVVCAFIAAVSFLFCML
ncbi:hypothetical protein GCM10025857_29230 [Alicyclobacillus contaminans]|nr:hypothetical protein GCM10025857_29230 [Alicyclobacillus contaminans]